MILIYAFANRWSTNISARVLNELNNSSLVKGRPGGVSFQKIYGHPKSFFQSRIYGKNYQKIVGIGDLYGNFSKIKLETIAKNQYSYKPISTNSPYQIPLNTGPLSYLPDIVISKNMGNYNCNWIAYQTQLYLNSHNLFTQHLFFHLPKKFPPTITTSTLINLIYT